MSDLDERVTYAMIEALNRKSTQSTFTLPPPPGTIYICKRGPNDEDEGTMSRSSFDRHDDGILVYKALEFRDAAKRDGRIFVCTLVPKWKKILLRIIGVEFYGN